MLHPFSLPGAPRSRRLQAWLASRGLQLTDPRRQDEAFFACLVAGEGLAQIGPFFYGDYFLESIDGHLGGAATFSGIYRI